MSLTWHVYIKYRPSQHVGGCYAWYRIRVILLQPKVELLTYNIKYIVQDCEMNMLERLLHFAWDIDLIYTYIRYTQPLFDYYSSYEDTYVWVVCGLVWLQERISKRHVFPYPEYDNHSKLNEQHNWEDLCDHLMNTRIFTLTVHKIFI